MAKKKSSPFPKLILSVFVIGFFLLVGRNVIISSSDGNILGVRIAKGGEEGSGSERESSSSQNSGSSGNQINDDDEEDEDENETPDEDGDELDETPDEDEGDLNNETETEIRISEEERIRARTKDGFTRVDITQGGVKTRFEQKDDRLILKAELEDGTETELEEDTLLKIEERLGEFGIKVATAGGESFFIQRGNTGAVTDFPLSIDLATNSLIVNTPSGEKTVSVLPDEAILNLLAANVVNRIGAVVLSDQFSSSNFANVSDLITLGIKEGLPVYEINGISDQKLLGFIPVVIEKEIEVSAETGEIVSTQASLTDRVIDFFSL